MANIKWTPEKIEVLKSHFANGMTPAQIAEEMSFSISSVKVHLKEIEEQSKLVNSEGEELFDIDSYFDTVII